MRADFVCPKCRATVTAPASLEGANSPCPKCRADVDRWPAPVKAVENKPPAPPNPPKLPTIPRAGTPPLPAKRPAEAPLELDDGSEDHRDRPRRRREESRNGEGPKKGVPPWVWILVGAGGLLFLCCGGGIALVAFKGATEKPATYTAMTADQLIDEWKKNPAAAAEKYKTNGVELTGRLHRIDSNIHRQTFIDVRGASDDWQRGTHIFVVDRKAKEGLAKCKVGDTVVVKARAEGSSQDKPWMIADEIATK